jgi:hypothetical protein
VYRPGLTISYCGQLLRFDCAQRSIWSGRCSEIFAKIALKRLILMRKRFGQNLHPSGFAKKCASMRCNRDARAWTSGIINWASRGIRRRRLALLRLDLVQHRLLDRIGQRRKLKRDVGELLRRTAGRASAGPSCIALQVYRVRAFIDDDIHVQRADGVDDRRPAVLIDCSLLIWKNCATF